MIEQIELAIADLVIDLLFYDRKEDEDLPMNKIEELIASGELTADEMIKVFGDELKKQLGETDD